MELIASEIVQTLYLFRAFVLRVTLRLHFIRRLYSQTHYRLAVGFLLTTAFYLPIALLRPELLLAFGPLIFGYPHLLASFRFTTKFKRYHVFVLASAVAIVIHMWSSDYPFGVWQMVVATSTFILSGLFLRTIGWKKVILAILVCSLFIRLAYLEPIIYVGASLIVHNFIAYFYWIRSSRTKARRSVAVLSSLIFLAIHLIVLAGFADSWIASPDSISTLKTGWLLASWTTNEIVWSRFLVLYAFGLSVHYFVWLRAIPETQSKFEHPNSVRTIASNLKSTLGKKTLIITFLIMIGMMILWSLNLPLGAQIYFEMALLHGSLELIYLLE